MPKAPNKNPKRVSRSSPLQVQPRRSTRQVAMQSLSETDNTDSVLQRGNETVTPDLVDAASETPMQVDPRPPRQPKKKPGRKPKNTSRSVNQPIEQPDFPDLNLNNNPILDFSLGDDLTIDTPGLGADNLPTISQPSNPHRGRPRGASNFVMMDDQQPSTSTGRRGAVQPQVNFESDQDDTAGPTRQEFLDLKEQIMTLTATLASVVSTNNNHSNHDHSVNHMGANVVANTQVPVHPPPGYGSYPPQDEIIRNIVDGHVQSMMSQPVDTGEVGNFADASKPIDLKVSDAMKQDIWANRYVDFNKLIDFKSPTSGPQTYQFVEGGGGQFS